MNEPVAARACLCAVMTTICPSCVEDAQARLVTEAALNRSLCEEVSKHGNPQEDKAWKIFGLNELRRRVADMVPLVHDLNIAQCDHVERGLRDASYWLGKALKSLGVSNDA